MGQTTSLPSGGLSHVGYGSEQPRSNDFSILILNKDYTSEIPDDCLALIFQFLSPSDRNNCSLICRRWRSVEGERRGRLALHASTDVTPLLPAIFTRFDSVTKLVLRCNRRSISIDDDGLIFISERCPNLTSLKIRGCHEITDQGMSILSQNCKSLLKFACGSCNFGAKGINALLKNCALEDLYVKRLKGFNDGSKAELVAPGKAAASLKSITLKELYNGQFFSPLLIESKNLRTMKILKCSGDWDGLLQEITRSKPYLTEIHLEKLQVSDSGLTAISRCPYLDTLHLAKSPDCSNKGLSAIAEKCKLLRKLHLDGWRTNRIDDEGLIAIANNSLNLTELVLVGVNPTHISMMATSSNCQKLERLALCGSDTIGDKEISCIAEKCIALKKLCVKCCCVTDSGMQAFAHGCPNLMNIKFKKCRGVSSEASVWLKAKRASLNVNCDAGEETSTSNAMERRAPLPADQELQQILL